MQALLAFGVFVSMRTCSIIASTQALEETFGKNSPLLMDGDGMEMASNFDDRDGVVCHDCGCETGFQSFESANVACFASADKTCMRRESRLLSLSRTLTL